MTIDDDAAEVAEYLAESPEARETAAKAMVAGMWFLKPVGKAIAHLIAAAGLLASILLRGFAVSWLLQWFLFEPLRFRPVSWLVISGLLAAKPLIHPSQRLEYKTFSAAFIGIFAYPLVLLAFGYLIHWWMLP